MVRDSFWPKAIAVVLAALILLSLLFAFLAEAIAALACGGVRPTASGPLAGTWLALSGDPSTYTTPAGCVLPVLPIRLADVVALLLLVGLTAWGLIAWARYQQSDARFLAELRQRPGSPLPVRCGGICRLEQCCAGRRHCGLGRRRWPPRMWGGGSAARAEWTCMSRSRTLSRWRARRDPGRATGS